MTEARLRRLVQTWAGRLGLAGWRLVVVVEDLGNDDSAEARWYADYDVATLAFAPFMAGRGEMPARPGHPGGPPPDALVEEIVVHELLHLWTRAGRMAALGALSGQVHRDAETVARRAIEHEDERLVDGLARALVAAWPA